jgi:SAM-dependent methyltransferase
MLREGYEVTAVHEATHWWFRSRRELVLRQVARSAAQLEARHGRLRILDYGCGTGFNLPYLAEFGEAVGADVSDLPLGEFRKGENHPRLDLREDLTAYHGQFSIVLALDVLEHCDDDVAALRAMSRFLKPEGQVVITVPAYQWLWSGEDVVSQHRRRYTRTELLRVAREADLHFEYASYFNLSVLPGIAAIIWARKLFNRGALEHSNLQPTARWLNETLRALTTVEGVTVGSERLAMPAGASLVARFSTGAHAQ